MPKIKPDLSNTAKLFLQKIEKGIYKGIISELTIAEVIKILREVMVESQNVLSPKDWKIVEEKAVTAMYNINHIDITTNLKKVDDSILSATELVKEGLRIMRDYVGKVEYQNSSAKHDGLHPMDAYHIILAKNCGCTKLATFDKDFDESKNEILPLNLKRDFW